MIRALGMATHLAMMVVALGALSFLSGCTTTVRVVVEDRRACAEMSGEVIEMPVPMIGDGDVQSYELGIWNGPAQELGTWHGTTGCNTCDCDEGGLCACTLLSCGYLEMPK